MAAVLGISGLYHDAAAALVVDGVIQCALQEERLSRVKNDPTLPFRAAEACLKRAGLRAGDLDAVVFYEEPFKKLERVLVSMLRGFPATMRGLPQALSSQWSSRVWVLDTLAERLGVERRKVTSLEHHHSHAASTYYCSPYESAAVLTVDGVGEHATTSIWRGEGRELSLVEQLEYPHSLGLFYSALTAFLGFEVNEGEYKVMGLSALGKPRYREEFAKLLRLHEDGSFELNLEYFSFDGPAEAAFNARLEALLGPRRHCGSQLRFLSDPEERKSGDDLGADSETQRFADIAASLQVALEEAMLGLARRARAGTGMQNLCLAGGVALNALANARIQEESGFANVFVQPAAGDAGGALGAALVQSLREGDERCDSFLSSDAAALGIGCDVGRAEALAVAMGLSVRRLQDPCESACEILERGEILAWIQGRGEFGPRALGQRSLLCRADDLSLKRRLNRVVKRREDFRPFAPVMLTSIARAEFKGGANDMTPFMTTVRTVRRPERWPAVTHIDGTARLQTASDECSIGKLLGQLQGRGRAPLLLNTSLNGRGEPIAAEETAALSFFSSHDVETMILEDLLITKGSGGIR